MATTVTSKGQVTIPKKFRELLGIGPGSKVSFELGPSGDVVLRHDNRRAHRQPSRFAQLRGTATVRMTTDEIIALTRGRD
jgi:AbrB family looped-hinge helix DNA binding protein